MADLEIGVFKSNRIIERCTLLKGQLDDLYEKVGTLKEKANDYSKAIKDNISVKTLEMVSKFYDVLDEIKEQIDDRLNKTSIGAKGFINIEDMD